MDGVLGDTLLPVVRIARIAIDVEVRKVAAANVDADSVPRFEQIGGRLQRNLQTVDAARLHQGGLLPTLPIAGPQDSLGDGERITVCIVGAGWIHVDQLDVEIGVRRVGRNPQHRLDVAGDPHVFGQGGGLEDQNVRPVGDQTTGNTVTGQRRQLDLIARPHSAEAASDLRDISDDTTTVAGNGVLRIVGVSRGGLFLSRFRPCQVAARVQVKVRRPDTFWRPTVAAMPSPAVIEPVPRAPFAVAPAHHKHVDRLPDVRLPVILQPAVEPRKLQVQEIVVAANRRPARAEIHVTHRRPEVVVRPGAAEKMLVLPLHPHYFLIPVADGARIPVVPTGHPQNGHVGEGLEVLIHA